MRIEHNENIYRNFFEYTIDLLCIIDRQGAFVELNPEWEQVLGYSISEMEGRKYSDFVHPDDLARTIEVAKNDAGIKKVNAFINRYKHKNGLYRWLEWKSFPDEDWIYASARDITKLKDAEEKLKAINDLHKSVFNTVSIGFMYFNGGDIQWANNAYVAIANEFSFIDAGNRPFFFDLENKIYNNAQKCFGIGKHYENILELIGTDNQKRTIHITGKLLDGKKYNGDSVWVVQDITDSVKKKQDLNLFKASIQLSKEGIYWINIDGNFIYVNEQACKMLGYTEKELLSISLFDLDPFYSPGVFFANWKKYSENKKSIGIHLESFHTKKDGSLLPVEIVSNQVCVGDAEFHVAHARDISERKRQEEIIAKNQKLLNESQRIAKMGSWEQDFKEGSISWSDSAYELYGVSKNKAPITEDLFFSIVHPDDRKHVKMQIEQAIRMGTIFGHEFRIVRNGTIRHIITTAEVLKDSAGKPLKMIGVMQDITDKKEADKALKDSTQKLERIFNVVPAGIGLLINRVITDANPQLCRLTGYTREELIGQNTEVLYPSEEEFLRVGQSIYKQVEENGTGEVEATWQRKDGELINVIVALTPIDEIDQEKGATFTTKNITERKRNEESLLKNQTLLLESQRIAKIGSWELNLEDFNMTWNKEACLIYGFKQQETEPSLDLFKKMVHPDDLDEVAEHFRNTLTQSKFDDFECRIITSDGYTKTIIVAGDIVFDKNGTPSRLYGIVQDITDKKKHEEQLVVAKEKAEESDKLKTAFLANLSHEIRTPMNGILGFAELLKDRSISKATQDKYIELIEQSGERMIRLINDLVDISKIESGQVELYPEKIDLNVLMNKLYDFFAPIAKEKGIFLSVKKGLPNGSCLVTLDNLKLEQILSNLLSNAFKFTEKGVICYGYSVEGDMLNFEVSDTGKGIPAKMQSLIFIRFRQVEDTYYSGIEGTGLGLSISKAFAEKMGGTIWVESAVNHGSKFVLTLPYCPAEEEDSPRVAKVPRDLIKKGTTVLVAEDDAVSFLLLNEMLTKNSFNVLHATNGQEAVRLYNNHPEIELILMDMKMPLMNGIDAIKTIRKKGDEVPIIAQTAYTSEKDLQSAIAAGCNAFVKKPVNIDVLMGEIDNLLPKPD